MVQLTQIRGDDLDSKVPVIADWSSITGQLHPQAQPNAVKAMCVCNPDCSPVGIDC
jgi:hypothetical protein